MVEDFDSIYKGRAVDILVSSRAGQYGLVTYRGTYIRSSKINERSIVVLKDSKRECFGYSAGQKFKESVIDLEKIISIDWV